MKYEAYVKCIECGMKSKITVEADDLRDAADKIAYNEHDCIPDCCDEPRLEITSIYEIEEYKGEENINEEIESAYLMSLEDRDKMPLYNSKGERILKNK